MTDHSPWQYLAERREAARAERRLAWIMLALAAGWTAVGVWVFY